MGITIGQWHTVRALESGMVEIFSEEQSLSIAFLTSKIVFNLVKRSNRMVAALCKSYTYHETKMYIEIFVYRNFCIYLRKKK